MLKATWSNELPEALYDAYGIDRPQPWSFDRWVFDQLDAFWVSGGVVARFWGVRAVRRRLGASTWYSKSLWKWYPRRATFQGIMAGELSASIGGHVVASHIGPDGARVITQFTVDHISPVSSDR